ncbi:MAG TPA: hypothetical protein VFN83_10950 [Gemmatimonadales bacterium]|jgi:uncharacterized membrane protein YcaP (DUF421 family)|nr:hypothetical protein [Gemmatimonadales bacterium]
MSTGLHDFVTNLLQFGTGTDHVSLAEKIVRPIVVYLLLVVTLKLIGRRVLAQFSAFDFVVLLLISNTVQNAIIGNDTSLAGGLIGGATLLLFNGLLVRILWRGPNRPLKGEGAEVALWQFGEQVDTALNQFHVTVPELQIKAHERGFDSLAEVNEVKMAPNGSLIFTGQESDSGGSRHRELLERLDALQREVAQLGRRL